MSIDKKPIPEWFDRLESALETEGRQASLLHNNTMVGSAREFLVKHMLRSILPPLVHIGSGKIIDAQGGSSRQVDIIFFDPRFPVFEIEPRVGLYPIEGVLGAIEVKSTLTKAHLEGALYNTRSILDLSAHLVTPNEQLERVEALIQSEKIDADEANRRLSYAFLPSIYVFAFNSRLTSKSVANAVADWFDGLGQPSVASGRCAILPRIVIAGKAIGALDDGYIRIDPGEVTRRKWRQDYGPQARHLMSFWETKHGFRFLASHILHTISTRFGLAHAASGVEYTVDPYSPGAEYLKLDIEGKKAIHNCWKGDVSPKNEDAT